MCALHSDFRETLVAAAAPGDAHAEMVEQLDEGLEPFAALGIDVQRFVVQKALAGLEADTPVTHVAFDDFGRGRRRFSYFAVAAVRAARAMGSSPPRADRNDMDMLVCLRAVLYRQDMKQKPLV